MTGAELMSWSDSPQAALAEHIGRIVPSDAAVHEFQTGVAAFRVRGPIPPIAGVMEPALCFILQGSKRAHFDGRAHTYEAGQFLLSTLSVPLRGEVVVASRDCPLIGVSYRLDLGRVAALMSELGADPTSDHGPAPSAVSVHRMEDGLVSTVARLCEAAGDPVSWRILGDGLRKELLFRVLQHPGAGRQLQHRLREQAGFAQVARAVAFIEANLTEPLHVDEIAKKAGLSASRLHARFRAATSRSPMQYVKYLRLHRAHGLLLTGESVTDVAFSVGYASLSQFSREFRRQYGHPPSQVRRQVDWAVQPELT